MPKLDLWLDSEDVTAAQSSGSFILEAPSDAHKRGNFKDLNDDKAKESWVQRFEIVESKMYEEVVTDKKTGDEYESYTFELVFQVPPNALRPTGEPDINSGRQHRAWYRIVPAAMKNKQHAKYKANNFFNGKLTSIIRSIWGSAAFPPGQRVNLGDYFGTDVLLKQSVVANVKNSKYEGEPKTELADFVPLEMITA
jgi:hypothetical protein